LRKLQLITEAKQLCPDLVIMLGESLDRFRDASKRLYSYLASFTWNQKVERLGFDEVFLDVTDIVEYNKSLLNISDLSRSFFHLSRDDPTVGFPFDMTKIAGHQYPDAVAGLQGFSTAPENHLLTRLVLGSHLAQHMRHKLDEEQGYASSSNS
jgi:DNA polymerase iota